MSYPPPPPEGESSWQPGHGQQPPPGRDPQPPAYGQGRPHGHPSAGQPYGYAHPTYHYGLYGAPAKPEHPEAVPSLVLGVIALGAGVMPFLLGLPLLLGPWAWIKARRTVNEIDMSGGQVGGRGQAKAGYICGVIATALLVLWVMGLSVLVAVTVLAQA